MNLASVVSASWKNHSGIGRSMNRFYAGGFLHARTLTSSVTRMEEHAGCSGAKKKTFTREDLLKLNAQYETECYRETLASYPGHLPARGRSQGLVTRLGSCN